MNLLQAINKLCVTKDYAIPKYETDGSNHIQEVGKGLEAFFKLLFIEQKTPEALRAAFCWQGAMNSPPDIITASPQIAIEIKKQTSNNPIQLNSSYPKQYLYKDNSRISNKCRGIIKSYRIPMIYAIGIVNDSKVEKLWIIDGSIYAAHSSAYTNTKDAVSSSIYRSIEDLCNTTNEIASIQDTDPLKNTILRVRGMWVIKHPSKVFSYLDSFKEKVIVILSKDIYNSFNSSDKRNIENNELINSYEANNIKNPDNPSKLLDGFIIKFD